MRLLVPPLAAILIAAAPPPADPVGIPPSRSEGARRQFAAGQEMQALYDRLLRDEADNFAGHWVERPPYWRVVFAFKRDAEATLRRYTSNPNFVARQVRYSMRELEEARGDATEQLRRLNVPIGMTDADEVGNDVDIVTRLEQPEVERLLASGRLRLHPAVKVTGSKPMPVPAVSPEAGRFIRIFPQDPNRSLGGTRELSYGTIVLRGGCLRFDGRGAEDPFVYFAAETGLKLDEAGRLAFYHRPTGRMLARVGEPLAMSSGAGGGPIRDAKVTEPINAACGPGPVAYGGWFESREAFERRNPR